MLDFDSMKSAIVDHAKSHLSDILEQFTEDTNSEEIRDAVSDVDNWRFRFSSRLEDESVEWCFNCEPLDDQLRAYILTDAANTKILRISRERPAGLCLPD